MRTHAVRPLLTVLLLSLAFGLGVACTEERDASNGNGNSPTPQVSASPSATPVAPPTLTDPALRIAETVSGLSSPTQVVFMGARDMLVTQKTGAVVHVRDGKIEGDAIKLRANFADERGVLGIALHPQFQSNRWVYVYWTWSGQGDERNLVGDATDNIETVPALGNRVDRFTWDGAKLSFDRNIARTPSKTTDLTINRRRGNHDAGIIKFGPDGKLYVAIGDQNQRSQISNVPDGVAVRGPEDLVAAVLRLNDDGSTPADNPFVAQGAEWGKVWLYGLRNTFGFTFDRPTGALWLEMNGQAAYDTIGRYERGDNLGWIQLMGPPERVASYKEIELPTERQLDSKDFPPSRLADSAAAAQSRLFMQAGAIYRPPLLSWKYAIALTDIEFVEGDTLGTDLRGDMLIGTVLTGNLIRMDMNSARTDFVLEGPLADRVDDNRAAGQLGEVWDAHVLGRNFGVVTDIANGPDGSVWVVSLSNGAMYRLARQ